jgi:hypothetical protein
MDIVVLMNLQTITSINYDSMMTVTTVTRSHQLQPYLELHGSKFSDEIG